jgi:hypothetical protein
MDAVPVVLTTMEARIAALVGAERRITALANGGKDRPGIKPESVWTIDIEGAGAELAFAKLMGWYWDGSVGVFHDQADVRHVNVRRQVLHNWDMAVRPHDREGVYVLVTGCLPRYRVHGWAAWPDAWPRSYEAAYDRGKAPARYIRQADLRPLADLPGEPE